MLREISVWLLASLAVVSLTSQAHADAPTPRECVRANDNAISLRDAKKLRAAREQLLTCASPSCPSDVRDECARNLTEVTAAIPTLVLGAQDAAGNDLVAVNVTMDGEPLLSRLDGSAVMMDPGEHRVEMRVAGSSPIGRTIVLREGEKDRHEVLRFEPVAAKTVRDPGRRALGLVTGIAGLAGIGVGIVAGALASSFWDRSKRECTDAASCSNYGASFSDYASANDWATVSTVAFIAGGATFVVGGLIFFTAPYVAPSGKMGLQLAVGGRL